MKCGLSRQCKSAASVTSLMFLRCLTQKIRSFSSESVEIEIFSLALLSVNISVCISTDMI